MRVILLLVFLAVSVVCIYGCGEDIESRTGETSYSFDEWIVPVLGDKDLQLKFIDTLKERNIFFEIRGRGKVICKIINMAEIYGLQRKLVYGEVLNVDQEEILLYSEKEYTDQYKKAFQKRGIRHYSLREPEEDEIGRIKYSQIYGPQVDEIRQQVEMENRGTK